MKYLIIAAVVSVLFVIVYTRLRPYLKLIQKVVNSLNVSVDSSATSARSRTTSRGENKLIRCDGCGTWIPADRAMNLTAGLSTYCSRECLEKKAAGKERKLAG